VGGVKRPGLVHRLDRGTSGVILLAKNDRAHHFLQQQFQGRDVEKVYLALVDGHPPTPKGRVEVAIGRDAKHRQRMAAVLPDDGKMAITEYFSLERFAQHSYLEVHPITGRTHQIRVHLTFLECPVVGDRRYGRNTPSLPLDRQFLHAARISLYLPREDEKRTIRAPLAEDLTRILNQLRDRDKENAND